MAEAKKNTKAAPKKKTEAPKREPAKSSKKTVPQNENNQLWSIILFHM